MQVPCLDTNKKLIALNGTPIIKNATTKSDFDFSTRRSDYAT